MGFVREKWLYPNDAFYRCPKTLWVTVHRPENKRAKIRGFYTTIRGFIYRIINKLVQKNRNEMHSAKSTDLNEERPHNRHLTRDK